MYAISVCLFALYALSFYHKSLLQSLDNDTVDLQQRAQKYKQNLIKQGLYTPDISYKS